MNLSEHWEIIVAVLAVAAGMWRYLRSFGAWLQRLLVVTVWVDSDAACVMTSYLSRHGRRRTVSGVYTMDPHYVKPLGRVALVPVESLHRATAVYWIGRPRRPLWYGRPEKPLHEGTVTRTFSWIRGTVDWDRLFCEASIASTSADSGTENRTRHRVEYHHGKTLGSEMLASQATPVSPSTHSSWNADAGRRLLHWSNEDIGRPHSNNPISDLALSVRLLEAMRQVRHWFDSRMWFASAGISWRLGHLYHGSPGTGKTSAVRAIAQELDLPVHVFDLASLSNEELRKAWTQMVVNAPCVALIEDIDAVFDGRENRSTRGNLGGSALTFDALLNCIDGIERHDGIFLVVTTNHLDKVDPALVGRRGRIDGSFEFGPLDFDLRVKVATRILGNELDAHRLAAETGDVPVATFAERCCRIAIDRRFSETPFRD